MLILGNGESRKDLDLNFFKETTVGCNAIYRDFTVDHLVCVDRRLVKESLESDFKNQIYTRKDWFPHFKCSSNVNLVPELPYKGNNRQDDPWHWGSGPYAVLLGSMLATGTEEIKLFGFDLYSSTGKINNIYKNTKNYESGNKGAVDPSYWVYQIAKLFECFPNKKYLIINKEDWRCPNSWKKSNVSVDKLSNV